MSDLKPQDKRYEYQPFERGKDFSRFKHDRFYKEEAHQERKEELKPMPIGDKCNQLCPFFKCSKNALVAVNRVVKGHVQKVAMCRWIGDVCLGYKCQFAFCDRKALLPDGRCAFSVKFKESEEEYIKELDKSDIDSKVKSILAKRTGRKDYYE